MNPTVMNQTAPQRHDDAARSLPQVEGVRHRFVQTSRVRVHIAEAEWRVVDFLDRSLLDGRAGR